MHFSARESCEGERAKMSMKKQKKSCTLSQTTRSHFVIGRIALASLHQVLEQRHVVDRRLKGHRRADLMDENDDLGERRPDSQV